MLRVAPACPVLFDKFDRALAEGPALGVGNSLRLPVSSRGVERVDALMSLLPMLRCLGTSLGERDIGEGAKAHVAPLTIDLKAVDPGFGIGARDAQVKPASVMQHRRPLCLRYLNRRELAGARHCSPSANRIKMGEG